MVPIKGDKIETKDGVSFKVLSYTNYKDRGPAVYVEHTPSVPSDAVYFFDIIKINGKTVEYHKSDKVFRSIGPLKRKLQLPQPNDIITWRGPGALQTTKVKTLKLHKKGALSQGLLIVGENTDSKELDTVRLQQMIDVELHIGNDLFSRDKFLSYYKDYAGTRS